MLPHFLSWPDMRETSWEMTIPHERNILVNNKFGIEIAQKQILFPVNLVSLPDTCKSNIHSNTILTLYKQFRAE